MGKLVVLKLDGDLEHHGFRVTLEIGQENARSDLEIQGNLPASPDLLHSLNQWRDSYCNLAVNNRIKPKEIIYSGSINRQINECSKSANQLGKHLQDWLDSAEFRVVNNTLREELNREETIRVLICSDNSQIQQLPWHLWDFFQKFTKAEFAFSTIAFQKIVNSQPKAKVKILAVLGNSHGIDVKKDREFLINLPNTETLFLVEPQRKELNNKLWEQPWQILFFAGHSETNDDAGIIHLNQQESLTIEELKFALRSAISQGLQLAIFNSCDGLGLARQLAALHIPQMIVMREPVPDRVAQEFLKYFLKAFTTGNSLYLALRQAREQLQGLENNYPNATWLPVIFQNQGVIPPTWQDLLERPLNSSLSDKTQIPNILLFFGRRYELATLTQAIEQGTRLIAITGMEGIGKTAVAAKLATALQSSFQQTLWFGFHLTPPTIDSLPPLLPQTLFVFDGWDRILGGNRAGQYRLEYEFYAGFLRSVVQTNHSSCVILTSREQPEGLNTLSGNGAVIFPLSGLMEGAIELLQHHQLIFDAQQWIALVNQYGGNPLFLNMAANFIQELFAGDVGEFLASGTLVTGEFEPLVAQWLRQISMLEQILIKYLATQAQGLTREEILFHLGNHLSNGDILAALLSLKRRALVETIKDDNKERFFLQPVIFKCVQRLFLSKE
ncbi:MAG: CHAT domain-containing protein [Nostoc desertorum CM1-VF14]|jgi:hypothetical protein|nr:CHAT domain-containing protein [Nostoc desertorum CM1-VF14]